MTDGTERELVLSASGESQPIKHNLGHCNNLVLSSFKNAWDILIAI